MNRYDVAHLLRRAAFGGSVAELDQWVGLTRAAAVDRLLDTTNAPADAPPASLQSTAFEIDKHRDLIHWWLDRMRTTPTPLVERMTLFWHNHFATGHDKVRSAALMYRQNALLRRHALGNYRDLVQQVAVNPAMLRWLDNESNVVGAEQENFARELMELFTLGRANYTEPDVVAMAKAWTGHNLDSTRTQYRFDPARHDSSTKTLFGVARNWDGPDAIDEILRGSKAAIAARFIVTKLWSWFAYPNPPAAVLDELTEVFLRSGLEMKPLLRAMFLHTEFWSASARQPMVRTPAEWVVASLRPLGLTAAATTPSWWLRGMGQELFNPPDVDGWKQNGYWVSSGAYWQRSAWAKKVWNQMRDAGLWSDIGSMTPSAGVQAAFQRFGVVGASTTTRTALERWFAGELSAYRKGLIGPTLAWLVMLSPEMTVG